MVFIPGTSDEIYLGLNKITEIGYFISANNALSLELGYGYNWTLCWESKSDFMLHSYFSVEYNFIVESLIVSDI